MQNQAEAQIENNFIRPLFRYLNWNTSNEGLAVADYEFIVNRTGRGGKRPDYTLQLDGQHLLVYKLYGLTEKEIKIVENIDQ